MGRKDNQSQIPLKIDAWELGRLIKKSNLYKSIRSKVPDNAQFSIGFINANFYVGFAYSYVGLQLKLYKKSSYIENKDKLVKTLAGLFLFLAHTSSGCLSFKVVKNTDDMFMCIVYRVVDELGNKVDTSFIESGFYTVINIENIFN